MRAPILLVLLSAMGGAGCGYHDGPTAPSTLSQPTVDKVTITVTAVSYDRYVIQDGHPVESALPNVAMTLVGDVSTPGEQHEKLTSASGAVSWQVDLFKTYAIQALGETVVPPIAIGGAAHWYVYLCGVDVPNSFPIPGLKFRDPAFPEFQFPTCRR